MDKFVNESIEDVFKPKSKSEIDELTRQKFINNPHYQIGWLTSALKNYRKKVQGLYDYIVNDEEIKNSENMHRVLGYLEGILETWPEEEKIDY